MATKKKSGRSSKTAHVLNILSGTKTEQAPVEQAASRQGPALEPVTDAAPIPTPDASSMPEGTDRREAVQQSAPELTAQNAGPAAADQVQQSELQAAVSAPPAAPQPVSGVTAAAPEAVQQVLPEAPTATASQAAPVPSMAAAVRAPIVEVARNTDELVSEAIRMALEEELRSAEQEDGAPRQTARPASVASVVPQKATAGSENLPKPDERKTQADDRANTGEPNEAYRYVNVMQVLVEEKAAQVMSMFDLCTCPRCVADVKALALSGLPTEYVVMQEGDVVPMLTVYEGRHNQAITAQLYQACQIVMKKPRHSD